MLKLTLDLDDLKTELTGILGAAFTRQEQMLMDFSNETKSALAQLQAAQDVTAAGLKTLTDRILATPVLTDDGAAQVAILNGQVGDLQAQLALSQHALDEANQREAAIAAAISSSAQVFSSNLNSALALVQPPAPAEVVAEIPAAPAAQDPVAEPVNPEAEQPIEVPAAPTAEVVPAEQVAESPVAEQPVEPVGEGADVVAAPAVDNAFMAAPPSQQPAGTNQPF